MATCGAENEAIEKLQFPEWPHEDGFKSESAPKIIPVINCSALEHM